MIQVRIDPTRSLAEERRSAANPAVASAAVLSAQRLVRPHGAIATPRRALVLVCLAFVALSLLVTIATPWGEANDEPDHVLNVETIIRGHWYRIEDGAGFQPHQAPLYYLGLAGWQRLVGVSSKDGLVRDQYQYTPQGPAVFRHDRTGDGDAQRLFAFLRLPSIALGLLTILLTAASARRLSRNPWTSVLAAAVVAFLPRFVFLSGVINNDNLANALAAGATLLAVVIVTTELSKRALIGTAVGLGILAGLLALTKFSTLPLVAAWVLALVLARAQVRRRLWAVAAFAAVFLATTSWWFAMNINWYGDPLAKTASEQHLRRALPGLIADGLTVHRALVEVPKTLWWSFVYTSGWNQFRWAWWWYLPFWMLVGVGLVGLVSHKAPVFGRRALLMLTTIAALALASIWVLAIDSTAAQARIAFIGLPALAVLIALGYERLRVSVPLSFVLPFIGLIGTVVALRRDVFNVFWS